MADDADQSPPVGENAEPPATEETPPEPPAPPTDEEKPKEETEKPKEEPRDGTKEPTQQPEKTHPKKKKEKHSRTSKTKVEGSESQSKVEEASEDSEDEAQTSDEKEQEKEKKKKKTGDAKDEKPSKKKDKAKKEPAGKTKKGKKEKTMESPLAFEGKGELEEPTHGEPVEEVSAAVKKKKSVSVQSIDRSTSSKSVDMGGKKKSKKKKATSKSTEEVNASSTSIEAVKPSIKSTEAVEQPELSKAKAKTKNVSISEVQLEVIDGKKKAKKGKGEKKGEKKKEKKVKKSSSITASKEKVPEEDDKKQQDKETLRKESSTKIKKTVSISTTNLKKGKKSQLSLEQLMSRLSMHKEEMLVIKKQSMMLGRDSSVWTLNEPSISEESEESDQSVKSDKYGSSVVMAKPKGKKGKGKKEKKEKKKKEPAAEEDEEDKKPKKKEKGKKTKEPKQEPEATIEPQDDVLAEITRMKYLAEIGGSEEEAEEAPKPPPKKKKHKKKDKKQEGPKKKLSKKEKARLAAEQAEKAKVNAEEAAAKAAELERIRLAEERKAAIEKEHREGFEQQVRMELLEGVSEEFRKLMGYINKLREDAKTKADWEFYVNCGRLPNPSKCDQMNTFLHLWETTIQETSIEEAARKTKDVLELLNELDGLIDTEAKDSETVKNWKWVRLHFRQQQAKSLDVATYRLLRHIEKNLNRIDIPTADYTYQDENVALSLWLRIQLPTPLPNPRRPPKPRIDVEFPPMKMEVQFPLCIGGEKMAVRALYVRYDHLSDLSETYDKPPIPHQYDMDLYTAMKKEWRGKLFYKYVNRVQKANPSEEEEEGEGTEEEGDELIDDEETEIPVVRYRKLEPTASEYVIEHEDKLYRETRESLIKTVPDDVFNLRKYSIIGGVYYLNLVHQPPQPQDFVTLEMSLTPLYLPKELELVDLYLDYNPPVAPPPHVRRPPEEIEEEMKKQDEELEKLVVVTLTWPEHVIFLELPMVCFWDPEEQVWTKKEVYDLKHNEEKGQLSFRTRKGAIFGLAVYRYANLPYQAWEMRPEANGTISLQITAAILMVEFNVKEGLIALSQLQNSPNNALQDIIGVYYELPKLIRVLQSAGVDVFPAFDAFCYIETSCEKHWPMEKNLYFNMAHLGVCFNFAWSRWNMPAGRRSVVFQMREYNPEKTKQKNHLMLHVTPVNAIYVDCTEVSQSFNAEGVEGMKFHPDLFHLMKGTSSMAIKEKVYKASKELVFACYELLVATRVVSFS